MHLARRCCCALPPLRPAATATSPSGRAAPSGKLPKSALPEQEQAAEAACCSQTWIRCLRALLASYWGRAQGLRASWAGSSLGRQQLGRQATAAGTASTLGSTAANEATSGTSVGQSVPAFNTSQQQQAIQDFLAYLQGGTGASNAATGQYSAEASAALGQQAVNNQALGGLGSLLGSGLKFASTW